MKRVIISTDTVFYNDVFIHRPLIVDYEYWWVNYFNAKPKDIRYAFDFED